MEAGLRAREAALEAGSEELRDRAVKLAQAEAAAAAREAALLAPVGGAASFWPQAEWGAGSCPKHCMEPA